MCNHIVSVCPSSQCSVAWCRSTGRGLETTAVGDASEAEECFFFKISFNRFFFLTVFLFHFVFFFASELSLFSCETSSLTETREEEELGSC